MVSRGPYRKNSSVYKRIWIFGSVINIDALISNQTIPQTTPLDHAPFKVFHAEETSVHYFECKNNFKMYQNH